jgi:1,2-diacylglycerol 3-alpha-glucosyltransferase
MKIGIFSDRYLPLSDGICTSIETFRKELEKMGHEVYVFAPKPSWRYKAPSSRIIFFSSVKGLFFDDYLTSFFFPPHAIRQIEKLNLDIIHYQTPGPTGLLGAYYALRKHIPLVTTYHTDLYEYVKHYPSVLPGTIGLSLLAPVITGGNMEEYRTALSSIRPERSVDKWNQKIVLRGLTLIHNHCDLVITPSHKMEKQLSSWGTTSRIETLPTGVDKITTNQRETSLARSKYKIAPTDKVVLFVGRLGTEKNVSLLIRAFNTIGRREPRAKLMIVGGGDDLQKFKDEASGSLYADRIIMTGWIDRHKLGAIYELATVYAFPSLADTQGLTLNEAAWAGLPIVITDPDVTEVVADGQNGYVAKNSARDVASKVLRIIQSQALQDSMGARSIQLASEISAGNQAVKLLRLYQETIERSHEKPQRERIAAKL